MTAKHLTGYDRLHNARLNKGTAFTETERRAFDLEGLLPPAVLSLELQVARRHDEIARLNDDLLKYLVLSDLQAPERDALLRGADVRPGDLHADCIYAHGR
jgi:malate dehydrogenase (oxaloacetate-decarboxylating)(NADP+)